MSADPNETARLAEQAESLAAGQARVVAAFYRTLVEEGVSHEAANTLTQHWYSNTMLASHLRDVARGKGTDQF